MKSLVVYETGYGNTERLARTIAEALHEQREVQGHALDQDHPRGRRRQGT